MRQPDIKERLEHILQAITHIAEFTHDGFEAADTMKASAVYYQLVIIGEAARHLPKELREQFTDIPWIKMMGLRNVLAHEYFALKHERILAALKHLPALKRRLSEIIETPE